MPTLLLKHCTTKDSFDIFVKRSNYYAFHHPVTLLSKSNLYLKSKAMVVTCEQQRVMSGVLVRLAVSGVMASLPRLLCSSP